MILPHLFAARYASFRPPRAYSTSRDGRGYPMYRSFSWSVVFGCHSSGSLAGGERHYRSCPNPLTRHYPYG
jgi:hypothetical protein